MSSHATSKFNDTLRGSPKKSVVDVTPSIDHVPCGLSDEEEDHIETTFNSFATNGEINGAKFAKFCRDNKLAGSKLSSTDIDLIFAKSKPKGFRKLNFEQFRHIAMPLVATTRGSDLTKIMKHICKNGGGPVFKGTQAERVRHHDDKSLYTGVYGRGGPTNAHDQLELGSAVSGFKSMMDRSDYDVRGRKVEETREEKVERIKSQSKAAVAGASFSTKEETTNLYQGTGNVVPRSPTNAGSSPEAPGSDPEAETGNGGCVDDLVKFFLDLNIPPADAEKYCAALKDDGFDVVSDLRSMDETDFTDIGMKKGHMRKVVQAAQACP
jgi:hypothetical protein